jgi:FdrA protein
VSRQVQVRKGTYQDSVTLMQVSQQLNARSDVTSALVAMATELNLQMLGDMGFDSPADVTPNDLVVAIDLTDGDAADTVLAALDELLTAEPRRGGGVADPGLPAPPTVTAAARRAAATLALVSTPGRVAALDAADALANGLDVMVFSDNVPVEHEIALKDLAAPLGRLVMGPDCGTAIVGGVGLGFANVVRPGPVGIVAASGTGAQQLLALLDGADVGVAACLGVGGRDLSAAVGARSTLAALDRLAADDTVTTIVLVSKPPADDVADLVTRHAESLGKPVVLGYLGAGRPDLTTTAAAAVSAVEAPWVEPRQWGTPPAGAAVVVPSCGSLRGLFSGGTLCDEAMLIAAQTLGEISSNIPLAGQPALGGDFASNGHTFIDFGDDALTVGRPHPMIDPTLRVERLARELDDPSCGVVLLDVVLGYGAHADPAADVASVISRTGIPVLVSLIGTRADPQGLDRTADLLVDAGALVFASNAAAARAATALVAREGS